MSIPPLVCSTPPPPDQCVDDKDHQDFDLSYNLSQDDDDDEEENNGYNYGNYTPYNHFQSAPIPDSLQINEHEQEIAKIAKSEIPKQIILNYEEVEELEQSITRQNVIEINDINENKLKSENDINIEDLNLQVDEEIESVVERNIGQDVDTEKIVNDVNIPRNSNDSLTCDITSPFEENTIIVSDTPKELNAKYIISESAKPIDVHIESVGDSNVRDGFLDDNFTSSVDEFKEFVELEETSINSRDNENPAQSSNLKVQLPTNVEIDDDFGDFDEFQSVSNKSDFTSVVENSGNPWKNIDPNESEFEKFTANFEESKFQGENLLVVNNVGKLPLSNKPERIEMETEDILESNLNDDHDDDFGDFDEFKSSTIKTETKETTDPSQSHELPVLNLEVTENEHQIMDRITTVLRSVFLEEISEPENDFEGKLESLLSETWGHLMETDERQPYIVNWNNSFGQKTLLKALCIDSRNILFGPKWGGNMPKYAANLSNAPLQPQKQEPSSLVLQNETVTEKPMTMPVSWSDPFTSDGQEFTYAEALLLDLEHLMATLDQMAHNHPTLKISELLSHACNTEHESANTPVNTPGPTDKDVFEATIPIKPENIFSNTIGIQPVRQINLPDTHIFTPTDSEIPRSKTIHYDLSANVLLPTLARNQNQTDIQISSNSEINSEVDKNEYWDFQNFKSSDTNSLPNNVDSNQGILPENTYSTLTTINALPQPSVAYQTELLQPIKIEPATPKLNWPDPGEVKEEFDDFSDFVSISQPANKQDNSSHIVPKSLENIPPVERSVVDVETISTVLSINEKNPDKDSVDEDFDTFQSALPTQSTGSHFGNVRNHIYPSEFINSASKIDDRIKSDTMSITNITRPENTKELTINRSSLALGTHTQGNLLQPIPANFVPINTQSQKKSGQILQPLSLESYSQINWPSPGIDLQDLSRFNPVETLHSLKSDLSTNGPNKGASPIHANQMTDDDVWGEFVSSKPKTSLSSQPKKPSGFVDDDEWTDFISSPSVKPQNGLNTISLNVHTNSNIHKSVQNKFVKKPNQPPIDIPALNYVTPKSNQHRSYKEKHFQNL